MDLLSVGEKKIPYTIKYSNRKSIGIEITYEGQLIVRTPRGTEHKQIEKVLLDKKEWIIQHIAHCLSRGKIKQENELLFLGRQLEIKVVEQPLQLIGINIEEKALIIKKPRGYELDLHGLLEGWLKKQASNFLREQVEAYSKRMNVTYNRITIKDQKTRWGSCSSKGNINFNYRLIMAPIEVLQYVVVHELAHRVHLNHSKAFWLFVEQSMPEYEQYRSWLREYGSQLVF